MHNLLTWEGLWLCFHSLCFYICLREQLRLREGGFIFNINRAVTGLEPVGVFEELASWPLQSLLGIIHMLRYSMLLILPLSSWVPYHVYAHVSTTRKTHKNCPKVHTQFNRRVFFIPHQRGGFPLVPHTICFSYSLRKTELFKSVKSHL